MNKNNNIEYFNDIINDYSDCDIKNAEEYNSDFNETIAIGNTLDSIRTMSNNKIFLPLKAFAEQKVEHPYGSLHGSAVIIISILYDMGSVNSVNELSYISGISYKNIAKPIRKLEELGYIELSPNKEYQKRASKVSITELGRKCIDSYSLISINYVKKILDKYLTQKEQQEFVESACNISRLLRKIEPDKNTQYIKPINK